jgi:hypothetical protein
MWTASNAVETNELLHFENVLLSLGKTSQIETDVIEQGNPILDVESIKKHTSTDMLGTVKINERI